MVLDHRLVPAGDEDEMLDAGLARFVHDVLDQRPVHHGEHFLRHGLGRRQEAGSQACDREYGFADAGHAGLNLGCRGDDSFRRAESMAAGVGPDGFRMLDH
jgi:hypothetical protein